MQNRLHDRLTLEKNKNHLIDHDLLTSNSPFLKLNFTWQVSNLPLIKKFPWNFWNPVGFSKFPRDFVKSHRNFNYHCINHNPVGIKNIVYNSVSRSWSIGWYYHFVSEISRWRSRFCKLVRACVLIAIFPKCPKFLQQLNDDIVTWHKTYN